MSRGSRDLYLRTSCTACPHGSLPTAKHRTSRGSRRRLEGPPGLPAQGCGVRPRWLADGELFCAQTRGLDVASCHTHDPEDDRKGGSVSSGASDRKQQSSFTGQYITGDGWSSAILAFCPMYQSQAERNVQRSHVPHPDAMLCSPREPLNEWHALGANQMFNESLQYTASCFSLTSHLTDRFPEHPQ